MLQRITGDLSNEWTNILISVLWFFLVGMEDISDMVNEHPFEVDLHKLYIQYIRSSLGANQVHEVRLESIGFVDFSDEFWFEWISDSENLPDDAIAQTLSAVLERHPSPAVLARALSLLPKLVEHEWNGWNVFPPRPTAAKSAIRYVETAIEKVGLWCGSGDFWDSVRAFYHRIEPNNSDAVRRIFVREIKAVPMSSDARNVLLSQLREFELTHSLSETTSIDSTGERLWNFWSAMEIRAQTDSSVFPEMILKRKPTDPPEYIRSLYARSVFADPTNVDYWLEYCRNVDQSEKVSVLKRAVLNNPYSGVLWLELVKVTTEAAREHAFMMGSSALRDSPKKDPESLHALLVAEIASKRENGVDNDELRSSYQSALSIMQEMNSLKHVASVFVSWMHFESRSSDTGFAAGVISQFLDSSEWEAVRSAMTPLQWVQLGTVYRHCSGDVGEIRKLYSIALGLVPEKYRYIILADLAVFEESYGDCVAVITVHQQLLELEKQAERTPAKKDGKKRPRDDEEPGKGYQVDKRPNDQKQPENVHQTRFVYMRDIPFTASEEALSDFLDKTCGAGTPRQVVIVRDDQGKSRGFGYAELDSTEQANRAIAKSGTKLKNRSVVILPSDREITSKRDRPHVPAQSEQREEVQPEEPKKRDNDYFRNLISRKQKTNS